MKKNKQRKTNKTMLIFSKIFHFVCLSMFLTFVTMFDTKYSIIKPFSGGYQTFVDWHLVGLEKKNTQQPKKDDPELF